MKAASGCRSGDEERGFALGEAPCVPVPLDRVHWLWQEQLLKSHLPRREPETAEE